MKKVLIVEKDEGVRGYYSNCLRRMDVELVTATSVTEGLDKFHGNSPFDLVVIGGCVPGDDMNTLHLVKEIKKTFRGVLMASSPVDEFRKQMMWAGCHVECIGYFVPSRIISILGL